MSRRRAAKPVRDAWQRHVGNRIIRRLLEIGVIPADPRVRVKIGRRWRAGTAQVVPEDDTRERLRETGRYNDAAVRFWGSPDELVTVRIDLDPT